MRVIAKSTLRSFWVEHPDSEQPLKSGYNEADKSIWINPNNIKLEYPSAVY
jgi:mRNA interferase HigB